MPSTAAQETTSLALRLKPYVAQNGKLQGTFTLENHGKATVSVRVTEAGYSFDFDATPTTSSQAEVGELQIETPVQGAPAQLPPGASAEWRYSKEAPCIPRMGIEFRVEWRSEAGPWHSLILKTPLAPQDPCPADWIKAWEEDLKWGTDRPTRP